MNPVPATLEPMQLPAEAAAEAPAPVRRGKRFWRQGEPFVWASGAALGTVLLLAATLLIVVMVNGLGVFWPKSVALVELDDGTRVLGQRIRSEVEPGTGIRTIQFKTANRELDSQRQDFHWYKEEAVRATSNPAEVFVLERTGNGDFYGFLEEVKAPNLDLPADANSTAQFAAALAEVRGRQAAEIKPLADRLSGYSRQLEALRDAILKAEYRKKQALKGPDGTADMAAIDARLNELRAEESGIKAESDQLVAEKLAREGELRKNVAVFRVASGQTYPIALVDVVRPYNPNGMGFFAKVRHYAGKVGELLWEDPRESNTEGGLFPAIFGTVMLIFLMSIACFPLGVLAGVYLGEYAREGVLVRLVRIAVNNLAGIPSIVYGIFGLGFFVYGVGGALDRWFFPERAEANVPTFGTGGILWASLTLGLLTVPVVIVATEEALRQIPRGIREGSYALGATKFQTLLRVLVPMASPGMMTGFILAMARAAGEVAPLMITGVVKLAPSLPADGSFPYLHLDRKFMHLGFHIFDVGFQSPNVEASKPMVFVTTFLLVLIVLAMSSVAIALRNRMRKRFQGRTI